MRPIPHPQKTLNSVFIITHTKFIIKKIKVELGMLPSWWSACLAVVRLWVPFPALNKPRMVLTSVIPALGRYWQEDQEFKVIHSYILSSKPAWTA